MFCLILDSDNEGSFRDTRRRGGSESNMSQSMLGTPMSFVEDNENDYESQADEIIDKVWKIFQDNSSWSQEAKSTDGNDVVQTKTYKELGKVFRLTVETNKKQPFRSSIFVCSGSSSCVS